MDTHVYFQFYNLDNRNYFLEFVDVDTQNNVFNLKINTVVL